MSFIDDLVASAPIPGNQTAIDYNSILSAAAEKYGISDKLPILEKMLNIESGGNVKAVSPKGARGLMQLMPGTAKALGVRNIFDPNENIDAGVRYFKEQLDTFKDDALALAAYNAGPGRVRRAGGIPKIKETQNDVNKILGDRTIQSQGTPYVFGGKDKAGFDCSGWVCDQLKAAGINVQDTAAGLAERASKAGALSSDPTNIRSGSLVFVSDPNNPGHAKDRFGNIKHTGIVVDHGGELYVSESRTKGGVGLTPLNNFLGRGTAVYNAPMSSLMPGYAENMVADVTGKTVPANVHPQQMNPEKEKTISGILGDLAAKIGPAQAEAAEPPKPVDWLDELVSGNIRTPGPKNIAPAGAVGNQFYHGVNAPVGDTGATVKLPLAPQKDPPDVITLGKAAMVDDPKVKFKILAESRFPGQPDKWKDYFINDRGDIMYIDKGIVKQEIPKELFERAKNFIATEAIGRGPENIGSAVGFVKGGIPGAMAGGAAGSIVRQEIAKTFLGDTPKGTLGEGWEAVKEALLAGAGGAISKGMAGTTNFALDKSVNAGLLGKLEQKFHGKITQGEINKWLPLFERYGVEYNLADITNSPTMQGLVQMLSQLPGPAKEKVFTWQRLLRTPSIERAIKMELNSIAPEVSQLEVGQMAQTAAAGVKSKLISTRKDAVSRLYNTAYETADTVDVQPIIEKIDGMIANVSPGGIERKQLEAMKKLFIENIKNDAGDFEERFITELPRVHSARKNLDKIISGKYDPSLPAVGNELNREANIIRNLTSGKMYESSELIKEADVTFARLSKPLNEYLYGSPNKPISAKPNTLISKIGKIENEEQLEQIPGKLFQATPKAISNMREWFISNGYEEEWNSLARGMLQDRLAKVRTNTANTEKGMLGANFAQKAFGYADYQNRFKAALSPDQFRSLSQFFELMEQTGKIVYANSQTTPMAVLAQTVRTTPTGIKDLPASAAEVYIGLHEALTSPRKLKNAYLDARFMDKQDQLWEALLNPELLPRLTALKKIPDRYERAIKFLGIMGGELAHHQFMGEKNIAPENQY